MGQSDFCGMWLYTYNKTYVVGACHIPDVCELLVDEFADISAERISQGFK